MLPPPPSPSLLGSLLWWSSLSQTLPTHLPHRPLCWTKMHCRGGGGLHVAENNPVCVYAYLHVCVRACVCVCVRTCMRACVHACNPVFYTFMCVCVYLCRNASISGRRPSAAWERHVNRWNYSSAWLPSGVHQLFATPATDGPRSSSLLGGRQYDIEAFLVTFEQTMEAYEIDTARWSFMLAPQLTGKAQQAYAAVAADSARVYDNLKAAILRRYNINADTYTGSAFVRPSLGLGRPPRSWPSGCATSPTGGRRLALTAPMPRTFSTSP